MNSFWVENQNSGRIGILDKSVERVSFDHAVILELSDGPQVRLESPFSIEEQGALTAQLVPESPSGPGVLATVALLHQIVASAEVDTEGALCLVFRTGSILRSEADPDYEAWQINSATGEKLISLPGAQIAYWSPVTA